MIEKKLVYIPKNSQAEPVAADFHGNNIAFICQNCGHPILAPAEPVPPPTGGRKKSERTYCVSCKHNYSLKWKEDKPKTVIITYEGPA